MRNFSTGILRDSAIQRVKHVPDDPPALQNKFTPANGVEYQGAPMIQPIGLAHSEKRDLGANWQTLQIGFKYVLNPVDVFNTIACLQNRSNVGVEC